LRSRHNIAEKMKIVQLVGFIHDMLLY